MSASASSAIVSPAGKTATIYGPAASRGWGIQGTGEGQYASGQYQQQQQQPVYEYADNQQYSQTARLSSRQPFYNTRAGDSVIQQARLDLSSRAKPIESNNHRSSQQDNRQRAYHAECVLPANIAQEQPTVRPIFQQYPLQEFNTFNLTTRSMSGPSTHLSLKKQSTRPLDVPRRHDLIPNLNKHAATSISNWDHNNTFLAKHTNNLFSS